jgi:hypothetical protein
VEEKKQGKKHKRSKMKVSETLNPGTAATVSAIPAAAADHNYDVLLLQRKSEKADNEECPIKNTEKDEK